MFFLYCSLIRSGSGCIVAFLQKLFFACQEEVALARSSSPSSTRKEEKRREEETVDLGNDDEEKKKKIEEEGEGSAAACSSASSPPLDFFFFPFFMAVDCNFRAVGATIETVRRLPDLDAPAKREERCLRSLAVGGEHRLETEGGERGVDAWAEVDADHARGRSGGGRVDARTPRPGSRRRRMEGIASDLFSCFVREEGRTRRAFSSGCVREEEERGGGGEERPCEDGGCCFETRGLSQGVEAPRRPSVDADGTAGHSGLPDDEGKKKKKKEISPSSCRRTEQTDQPPPQKRGQGIFDVILFNPVRERCLPFYLFGTSCMQTSPATVRTRSPSAVASLPYTEKNSA